MSRTVKGKLLADQGESRAFVNNSRDLLGVQRRLLNLLEFFVAIRVASAKFACCNATQSSVRSNFHNRICGHLYNEQKYKNARHCCSPLESRGRQNACATSVLWGVKALPEVLQPRRPRSTGTGEGKKSRPVSRVLSWTVIPLGLTSPSGSSNLPGSNAGRANAPLFGLAPSGVCLATRRCPRARCALTAPFHPCHACLATPFGGLFSVALSVGSRRPGVTWHSALWSPDFPRGACAPRDCLADSTTILTRTRPNPCDQFVAAATRSIAEMLTPISASRVAHDETLIRIAVRPCQTVPPHQQVPSD